MSNSETLINIVDVDYSYPNGTPALKGLNLDVATGESVAIIGPSGCGKSTLLQLLADLAKPTHGQIEWHQSNVQGSHPMSMVFQKETLLPWLTVESNVALHFKFRRGDRAERGAVRERIAELLAMVKLEHVAKSYPYQLSGGMRRRAQFLSAVAPLPRVLLLDEPFSALDEPTRVSIHEDVFDIITQLGITLLTVTHDLAEAITLSDRVVVLSGGPGRVAGIHQMPFGRERKVRSIREDPAFLNAYATLWHELSAQTDLAAHTPRGANE